MREQYLFNEPGSIPGIRGIFAHCRVTVDEAGDVDVQPLAQHPAYTPGPETAQEEVAPEQLQAEQPVDTPPPEQTVPPVQITVSQGG